MVRKIMVGGLFCGLPTNSITTIKGMHSRAQAESLAVYEFIGSPYELSHVVGIEPDMIKDKEKWTYFKCGNTKYVIDAVVNLFACQAAINYYYKFHGLPIVFITEFESSEYLKQKAN
jgi:hypothetical protein